MQHLTYWLRWGTVGWILATFLAYGSPYVSPETFWPAALIGLFYPWLLLGNVFLVLFWLFRKDRYFIFPALCILTGWSHLRSLIGITFNAPPLVDGQAVVKVWSQNCYGFRNKQNYMLRYEPEELPELSSLANAEVICLQEFISNLEGAKKYVDYFQEDGRFPNYLQKSNLGLAIFTKYPVKKHRAVSFGNFYNGYQYADLQVEGKIVRVYNVHLQSNAVSSYAHRIMDQEEEDKGKTYSFVKGMIRSFRRSVKLRAKQAATIAESIADCPYPVIVCGDFNDVPQSYTYRFFVEQLKDAFKERGKGFGFTYAGRIPALRIDYILVTPKIRVVEYKIEKTTFSDHKIVQSTLILP